MYGEVESEAGEESRSNEDGEGAKSRGRISFGHEVASLAGIGEMRVWRER
jgi:hypothetical protein